MQHLRALARRISPRIHLDEHVDVPPMSEDELRFHAQQGRLADMWAERIHARADQIEADVQRGLEDLRREADLMSGEAFGQIPPNEQDAPPA
jgi:hypothetical protein